MAIGAVVNAMWDLYARREGKPLWRLLADMSPQQLVDLVDFRYLTDALDPDGSARPARPRAAEGAADREQQLLANGYPAYIDLCGLARLPRRQGHPAGARRRSKPGSPISSSRSGADIDDDVRRVSWCASWSGPDIRLSIDANQTWGVDEAIASVARLAPYESVLGRGADQPGRRPRPRAIARAVAPVKVATGEHVANRVIFKQLLASGAIDVCQIDASRVAGVNENVAILLLAAKFGVPVCPHAGGVGLCEVVQHLAMFDFVAVSGTTEDRWIEYVDHLHEHFVDPVRIDSGRYVAPRRPGNSARMLPESIAAHRYPDGRVWQPDHASS